MSKDFLTDNEMAQMEVDHSDAPDFISDDEMAKASPAPPPAPAPEPGIVDKALALGQKALDAGSQPMAPAALHAIGDPVGTTEAINAGASQIGRGAPGGGLATKAGYGLSAFLSSITPDSVLPENLKGKTIGELYDHFKQQDQDTQKKLLEEHPTAAALGAGAGAMVTPIPGAGLTGLGGAAARVGGMTAVNALDQGTRNPDKVFDTDAALAAAKPTAALTAGLEAIPAVAGLAPALSDFAENRSAAALGMTKAIRKKIGNEAAQSVGRVGLDEGIVTPMASTADKIAGMQALQEKSGQEIGGVMDTLDQAGVKTFDPISTAAKVDEQMGATYKGEPLFSGLEDQYDNLMSTIAKRGAQPIPFAEAQRLKELLGQYGYREGHAIVGREQAQQAYGIVNQALDEAVANGASQLPNSPDLLAALQKAKTNFQASKNAMTGLVNKDAAEQGNRSIGLTDMITGSAAAATHGGPAAVAVVGGKKLAEKFGQNVAAWGADRVSKRLSSGLMGRYTSVLQAAAKRGTTSLAVTHYLLSQQDPAYQAMLQSVAGDDKPQDDGTQILKTHLPAE